MLTVLLSLTATHKDEFKTFYVIQFKETVKWQNSLCSIYSCNLGEVDENCGNRPTAKVRHKLNNYSWLESNNNNSISSSNNNISSKNDNIRRNSSNIGSSSNNSKQMKLQISENWCKKTFVCLLLWSEKKFKANIEPFKKLLFGNKIHSLFSIHYSFIHSFSVAFGGCWTQTFSYSSVPLTYKESGEGGRHCTAAAFALLTQPA